MNLPSKIAYCTISEAAGMLGVPEETVQIWVESDLLDTGKTDGGELRIHLTSVQRLLDGQTNARQRDARARQGLRLKVLVVEDDRLLLKLYKTQIEKSNLPVDLIFADNGFEALIRVGRDAPDLMITDLQMPDFDGFQMIHRLAAASYLENMSVVVVSGLDAADMEAHGDLPKGIRILRKPVPFDQLRDIITGLIERLAPAGHLDKPSS